MDQTRGPRAMTGGQDSKYWRRWSACCRANNWRMVGGRLHPDAIKDASEHHRSVLAAALQLAADEAKGLDVGHLRHACHIVALGRDKSHTKFTNKEFDALLNYWGDERAIRGLLIEPDDLASEIHRSNPALKTRERMLVFLKEDCVGAYVAKECDRMFGMKDWQALDESELTRLYDHLRDRPHALRHNEADPDWNVN